MTIAVLAQPYVEVGNKKIKLRIINTLFALAIFLIAFSVPGNIWIHMIILMALILIGDMFFQFETNVIGSTMLAVISKTAVDPSQMLSISLYRFSYVAAACIILLLVDVLVFPKRLTVSLEKQLHNSLAVNQQLRGALFSASCSPETIHRLVAKKRSANQRLKHINQFVQHPDVTAYLMTDEGWLNQLSLLAHRMELSSTPTSQSLQTFLELQPDMEQSTLRQQSILSSLNDVLDDITQSEALVSNLSFAK
jgi:uncharacterized membrane protein YccC